MYDTKLVVAAQQGDDAAFAALYDRNAEAVYDFCWGLTGDERQASTMVEDAFVLAARHIDDITDASQVRPWLLAIARDRALADDQAGQLHTVWGTEPAAGAGQDALPTAELRRWAREAGATLALADQAVLELATRHDLDGDQLACAIGCDPEQLDAVVAQVDRETDEVLGALVVARQGRKDCADLAALLEAWDGAPSVEVAEQAAAHIAGCERCGRRLALGEPRRLVAGAPKAALPTGLRAVVLDAAAPELAAAAARRAAGEPSPAALALAALAAETAGTEAAAGTGAAAAAPPVGVVVVAAPVASAVVAGAGTPTSGAANGGNGPSNGGGAASRTVVAPAPPPVSPPADLPGLEDGPNDGPPWLVIVAAALAVAVLIAIVALAVRGSPKSGAGAAATTTVPATSSTAAPTSLDTVPETLVPVSSSTTATTSTTVPATGHLQLDSTNVDLGASSASAQVLLSNSGPGPVAWKAAVGPAWLSVNPSSGTLKANASQSVTVAVDRAHAPVGTFSVQVGFVVTGTGSVGAVLTVNGSQPAPTTSTTAATSTTVPAGPQITGVSATQVNSCQAQVTATITDAVAVSSAVVSYTLPNGAHGSAAMTNSSGQWSAIIAGWTTGGSITFAITATDAQSASTTYPSGAVTVTTCP